MPQMRKTDRAERQVLAVSELKKQERKKADPLSETKLRRQRRHEKGQQAAAGYTVHILNDKGRIKNVDRCGIYGASSADDCA